MAEHTDERPEGPTWAERFAADEVRMQDAIRGSAGNRHARRLAAVLARAAAACRAYRRRHPKRCTCRFCTDGQCGFVRAEAGLVAELMTRAAHFIKSETIRVRRPVADEPAAVVDGAGGGS